MTACKTVVRYIVHLTFLDHPIHPPPTNGDPFAIDIKLGDVGCVFQFEDGVVHVYRFALEYLSCDCDSMEAAAYFDILITAITIVWRKRKPSSFRTPTAVSSTPTTIS